MSSQLPRGIYPHATPVSPAARRAARDRAMKDLRNAGGLYHRTVQFGEESLRVGLRVTNSCAIQLDDRNPRHRVNLVNSSLLEGLGPRARGVDEDRRQGVIDTLLDLAVGVLSNCGSLAAARDSRFHLRVTPAKQSRALQPDGTVTLCDVTLKYRPTPDNDDPFPRVSEHTTLALDAQGRVISTFPSLSPYQVGSLLVLRVRAHEDGLSASETLALEDLETRLVRSLAAAK